MARTRLVRGTLYITSGIMTGFPQPRFTRPADFLDVYEWTLARRRNLVILFPRFIDRVALCEQRSEEGYFGGIHLTIRFIDSMRTRRDDDDDVIWNLQT